MGQQTESCPHSPVVPVEKQPVDTLQLVLAELVVILVLMRELQLLPGASLGPGLSRGRPMEAL